MTYEFEHSVVCRADRTFAWKFWSTVENWPKVDSSVESVTLDGPFVAGTTGITKPAGASPVSWTLVNVEESERAVIGIELPGAMLRFTWNFQSDGSEATKITQTLILDGEQADAYADGMKELERGIPHGMQSLVNGIEQSWLETR